MARARSDTATSYVTQATEKSTENIQRGTRVAESVSNCGTAQRSQLGPGAPTGTAAIRWNARRSIPCNFL